MSGQGFTVYDKADLSTWPPGDGYDVLVCYRDSSGGFVWTVEWSNYAPDSDAALYYPAPHFTDWADLHIQNSPWVAWRLLTPETDAPNGEAAAALAVYYDHHAESEVPA